MPGNPMGQVGEKFLKNFIQTQFIIFIFIPKISLNANHKYMPRLHVYKDADLVQTFLLSDASFIAVTAYQNEMVIGIFILEF